ncbi:MAG: hypothetical protein WBE40_02705 [Thermoplasmata archaeon]
MTSRPAGVHWAVALAALVGGVAGSFVALSIAALGPVVNGSLPLLAGGAAIYVGSLLGASLGASIAAITAFAIGRKGNPRLAAISGSFAGIVVGVLVGLLSEGLARSWVNAFSVNPLEGALVGGAIAGGFAGVAAAGMLRIFGNPGSEISREGRFAALLGSVLGVFAGMGGASIGATLAQSVVACPNGYYANSYQPAGCVPGILQGALLIGLWAGAILGALGGFAAAFVLSRLGGPAGSTREAD